MVRVVQGMDFVGDVGEVFVVDWASSVGWASGRGEIRYWSIIVLVRGILVHGVVRGLNFSFSFFHFPY